MFCCHFVFQKSLTDYVLLVLNLVGQLLSPCFLAHLSRRLMGELIVYQSLRRMSVVRPSTISNIYSGTTGPIELLLRMGERKFVQMILVT